MCIRDSITYKNPHPPEWIETLLRTLPKSIMWNDLELTQEVKVCLMHQICVEFESNNSGWAWASPEYTRERSGLYLFVCDLEQPNAHAPTAHGRKRSSTFLKTVHGTWWVYNLVIWMMYQWGKLVAGFVGQQKHIHESQGFEPVWESSGSDIIVVADSQPYLVQNSGHPTDFERIH